MPYQHANDHTDIRPATGKGKKRRMRLFMLILLGFMVWAGLTIYDQYTLAQVKADNLRETEQRLIEQLQTNEQYKRDIKRLHDPEYIEQMINKNLQMKKEGETLYQVYP